MSKLRPTSSSSSGRSDPAAATELVGARVHVDVTIPRSGVRGRMRLISRAEKFAVEAETRGALEGAGFPVDASAFGALGAGDQWQYERAVRILAIAVRDPANEALALAPLDDWRGLDDDQIAALWQDYQDLEARLDPLGSELVALTDAEVAAFVAAAKKKDVAILMSYGSRKLASFIATSADPPST